MLVAHVRRMSAKRRAYVLLGLVAVLMVVVALASGGAEKSRAQAAGNCVPVTPATTPPSLTCTITTTTAVAAGGTVTVQLTNPNLAVIAQLTGVPVGCAVATGVGTAVVTLACAIASLGMPSGTILTEVVQGAPISTAQYVTQSVTYNANGPAPQVPIPTTESGSPATGCTTPVLLAGASTTCTFTPSVATVGTSGSGASIQITSIGSNQVGNAQAPCFVSTIVPTSSGTSESVTYSCAVGAAIPAGTPITADVTNTGTSSATLIPTVTENANGPLGPTQTPFPEILDVAACPAFPPSAANGTPVTCPSPGAFTPPFEAQAGYTLAFQITAAVGQTIYVDTGGAPATIGVGNLACSLETALPTSVTFPEGTVVISYSCDTNQVASPPGPGILVTDANGVGGAPTQVVAVIAPNPPPGIPPPATVSQVLTIAGVSSPSANTPVVTGISPNSGPTGGGTMVTITGTGFTGCTVVSFGATHVAATPSSDSAITVSSPLSPLPSPGTGAVDVTVGGGVCSTSATSAADQFTYTAGTSGSGGGGGATSTPSPTPFATGAAGFCNGTAVAGGCITLNGNCVNPSSGVTLPAQPAIGAQPAVATGGPYHGATGEPVQFNGVAVPAPVAASAQSFLITSCRWDFGDGSSSRFLNPSHTYVVSGHYTATLTVVESNAAPTASFVTATGTATAAPTATPTALTATATTDVFIAAVGPLCQLPIGGGPSGLGNCFNSGPGCPSTSFNNNLCAPSCPFNGETLLPNQCPGPATGNQVWINGPYNVQVDVPITVNVDTNLPGTSPLLPGDTIKFDWGDGSVNYSSPTPQYVPNTIPSASSSTSGATTTTTTVGGTQAAQGIVICADQTAAIAIGPNPCANFGGPAPIVPGGPPPVYPAPSGFNPAFPAPMTMSHAYTYPGTYTIRVTITFSDGTAATAQSTATVGGSPATVNSNNPALPPPQSPPGVGLSLQPGCNMITLTFPDGTGVTAVAQAVSGTTVISIGENPDGAPPLVWYPNSSGAGGANSLLSVRHGDTATICVAGAGSLNQPAS